MGLSPHQVLSRLSEQKRDDIQASLAELERQRMLIEQKCDELKEQRQQLMHERDVLLHGRSKASMLMMLGEAMQEQHLRLQQLGQGLDAVKAKSDVLRKEWIAANQTCEVHEKMQGKIEKKAMRKQEQHVQRQMDDVFAARFAKEVKHS